MLRPWTWAMKDRMSLVVCSALNTWWCPLWMGGRWDLLVVLWRSWLRYWSNWSFEPSAIRIIFRTLFHFHATTTGTLSLFFSLLGYLRGCWHYTLHRTRHHPLHPQVSFRRSLHPGSWGACGTKWSGSWRGLTSAPCGDVHSRYNQNRPEAQMQQSGDQVETDLAPAK